MSSSSLSRKQFLALTATSAAVAGFLQACGGDDPVAAPGTAGTGGTGTAGTGTAGTGTAGTGTAGTGTAGTGTAGTGTGGMSGSGTGGSGGASGGSGGASGGSGGASGGSGGASGGSGGGGGGGGMCGTANIMHTSNNQHTHIPADATQLKMSLKTLINGGTATMEFTVPSDSGQNGQHVHKFKLTAAQVTTLKGGGMVPGIVTFDTMEGEANHATGHTHTYTLSCMG